MGSPHVWSELPLLISQTVSRQPPVPVTVPFLPWWTPPCQNPNKSSSLQLCLPGKMAVIGWQELDSISLGVMTLFILSHHSCGCRGTTGMNNHSHVLYRCVCTGKDGRPIRTLQFYHYMTTCATCPVYDDTQGIVGTIQKHREMKQRDFQVFNILCCGFMYIFIIFLMLVTWTKRPATQASVESPGTHCAPGTTLEIEEEQTKRKTHLSFWNFPCVGRRGQTRGAEGWCNFKMVIWENLTETITVSCWVLMSSLTSMNIRHTCVPRHKCQQDSHICGIKINKSF